MISLILPYWNRQAAADKAFETLAQRYAHMRDLEVIVVDDGSEPPFRIPDLALRVRVVRLPTKAEPKSPVTCWNEGVKAARGDVIVLSCVEVQHERPVLEEMLAELGRGGPNTYVVAAAWCPETKEWHAHSRHTAPGAHPIPMGTARGFCSMLYRELYERIGGWDEAYREGAGYEDVDFIMKLQKAGARFVIRDDLVVTHPKTGASINWGQEKFAHNKAIFEYKWVHRRVNFVCVKAGTAYGAEYVNKLHDMVKRNLPLGFPGQFFCFTDDPAGLDDGIEVRELPADLERWWGKLYLFKRGLFPDGERVIFMDLDTVIVGAIEEIAKYDGQFATLKDFYHPERVGPAVMLWEAGAYTSSIWEEWVAEGKPRHQMGDLWWINRLDQGRFAHRCDKLQDLFPGAFVSYKAHCHPYPPKGTKVVCFHGEPRPHNCGAPWVKDVWRVGGGGMSDLEIVANTEAAKVMENVKSACARGLRELDLLPEHAGRAVLVGGGPSVASNIEEIRALQASGSIVVALNGSARYLKRHGILADWQVIVDSRAQNAAFVLPEVPRHFICSQCDPAVFEAAPNAVVFHVNTEATLNALGGGTHHLISTGSTVGLIAIGIAHTQGFRVMGLYGYDSSYSDASHHAYEQKLNDDDRIIEAVAGGRTFRAAPWMVAQVQQFQELATQLAEDGCTITVAGDGLLPHVARLMTQQEITT